MNEDHDAEREHTINEVMRWLKRPGSRSTLMGRFFDIGRDEGKREFAEWFTDLLIEMDDWFKENGTLYRAAVEYAEANRPEFVPDTTEDDADDERARHHPQCIDPEGHPFDGNCPRPFTPSEDPQLAGFDHHAHCAGANYEHLFPGVCPRLEEL